MFHPDSDGNVYFFVRQRFGGAFFAAETILPYIHKNVILFMNFPAHSYLL